MSRQFTITSNGGNDYTVAITDNGSFSAFAEPNNADGTTSHPINVNGSVTGTQKIHVTSGSAPNASALPSRLPGTVLTPDMINILFPGGNAATGQWDYS
jgi:hypothetical protein